MALRNFSGFDAPVLVFCYIPKALREWTILDLGFLLGYISLLALQNGLGTCFQATLASYPEIVNTYTGLGEENNLMVGFSIGYPDLKDPANAFYSERAPLDEILTIVQ